MQKNDNHQSKIFSKQELLVAGIIIACAAWALCLIFLGKITF
jgi:hypothetical protein